MQLGLVTAVSLCEVPRISGGGSTVNTQSSRAERDANWLILCKSCHWGQSTLRFLVSCVRVPEGMSTWLLPTDVGVMCALAPVMAKPSLCLCPLGASFPLLFTPWNCHLFPHLDLGSFHLQIPNKEESEAWGMAKKCSPTNTLNTPYP